MAPSDSLSRGHVLLLVTVLFTLLSGQALGVVAAQPASATVSPGSSASTGPGGAQSEATITNVTVSGEGTFFHNGTETIWRSASATVAVTIETADGGNGIFDVCAGIEGDGTPACTSVDVENGSGTGRISLPPQENVTVGRQELRVNVSNSVTGLAGPSDIVTVPVTIAEKKGDIDSDRLNNVKERRLGLNMTNPDVDGDGLLDGNEVDRYGTDPTEADTDSDGALDGVEVSGPSNATVPDTDGDGLLDGTELDAGLDPTNGDSDDDGLSDSREYEGPTDPDDPDTDGDGLNDGTEVRGPTNATSADTDSDGVPDGQEVELGLDPNDTDTDGDLLRDGLELTIGTDPGSAIETVLTGLALAVIAVTLAVVVGRRVLNERGVGNGETVEYANGGPGDVAATQEPTTPEDVDRNADPNGAADRDTEPEPDPTLLPPDERVQNLLRDENGRMRQAEIVESTDWSKAKVSRTLSDMEDAGDISRFRLGRENVVTLSDDEADEDFGPEVG